MDCKIIKIFNLIIVFLLMVSVVYAAPPTRTYTYTPNTTIDPNQNNTNENSLFSYLQVGVDTYAAGSITGAAISSSASIPYVSLSLANSIQPSDIASGHILLPTGAAFFMFTGSCPSGTTDVTSTYSNKFIKINSTQGTTSGLVLTGTTDSHVLDITEIPAHTHTVANQSTTVYGVNGGGVGKPDVGAGNTGSAGGGGGHTHTISGASTLEPSSVTMKLCVVN